MLDQSIAQIVSALQSGRAMDAEQEARRTLAAQGEDSRLLTLIAIALDMQDRSREAADVYRRLIELEPGEIVHRNNLGGMLRAAGAANRFCHACFSGQYPTPTPEDLVQLTHATTGAEVPA